MALVAGFGDRIEAECRMFIDPTTCQHEIVELHAFFEAWFNGDLPQTTESLARFENAMADSFSMHTPMAAPCASGSKTFA